MMILMESLYRHSSSVKQRIVLQFGNFNIASTLSLAFLAAHVAISKQISMGLDNSVTMYGDAGTHPQPFVCYGINGHTNLYAQVLAP